VRIISGKYRGKQIHPPARFKARPTTDFAKENLFNILANHHHLEDMEVLDLFSGTGSMSYEFVSRGAASVLAIELNQQHFRFILDTARDLHMDRLDVIRSDVFRFLQKPPQSFDLIFADPPYDHPRLPELPDLIFASSVLSQQGTFILEHPSSVSFTAHMRYQEQRKYGSVNFSFFN